MNRLTNKKGLRCMEDGCIKTDEEFTGCQNCPLLIEAIEQLQKYEDAIEAGEIIRIESKKEIRAIGKLED